MATLTKAHNELFKRNPDEVFDSFDALLQHTYCAKDDSREIWVRPQDVSITSDLTLFDDDGITKRFNDWSFSQVCRLAGVSKDTVNRLCTKTASQVLLETMPSADKPLQLLSTDDQIRSVHGVTYTRLWNASLLDVVNEFASDFVPPQVASDGVGTGLYCGEQDMFAFLIDPTGWVDIDGQAFAPGFFVWNSEVGRRSVGIQTFWFQKVCQNHIVWDATEVVEFSRKHTANVGESLNEIRRLIGGLIRLRDQRKDSFAEVVKKAMTTKLGRDSDEVQKFLLAEKLPSRTVKKAMEIARKQGGFTIFSLVDALTQVSQTVQYAGDRSQLDTKIGQLLALAA